MERVGLVFEKGKTRKSSENNHLKYMNWVLGQVVSIIFVMVSHLHGNGPHQRQQVSSLK